MTFSRTPIRAREVNAVISLKKLNDRDIVINCELIKTIECMPDTLISLTTGEKLIVTNGVEEIVRKVIEYKRAVNGGELEVYTRQMETEEAELAEG